MVCVGFLVAYISQFVVSSTSDEVLERVKEKYEREATAQV